MAQPKKQSVVTEVVKYGVVGVVSTVIDMGILKLSLLGNAPYWLGLAFGFGGGTVNGYFMNSRWTFNYNTAGQEARKFSQFAVISMIGFILTEIIGNGYVSYIGRDLAFAGQTIGEKMVGKLIAVMLVFFWNYGANKVWTFRSNS